ncbi:LOW QUALITY PROTEIN: cell death activator CIDE-B [Perognathus longimembris pacificus]|uniref:LOW QUALITY PROTEIN: cell death activator CIDE-B n=1 Tax=Perognathus longimembris pacificus TaxID=214514 RepID=UPI002018FCB0|nr:LOW QUALITY PROTEIN: cell death activator CIDE-B [Perognathus longimembris pacificus]
MDRIPALSPHGLLRSVSNISSELGRRVWSSAPPPPRPFRVCDHKRALRKGLAAATRQELLDKSGVLTYGLGREKPKHSKDIARITLDVYKQSPRDLFGSLNVKATFYGLYSMSCDFQGLGPKKVLRELLRWTSSLLQGLGRVLLGISSTLRHLVEGAEQWHPQGHLRPY